MASTLAVQSPADAVNLAFVRMGLEMADNRHRCNASQE